MNEQMYSALRSNTHSPMAASYSGSPATRQAGLANKFRAIDIVDPATGAKFSPARNGHAQVNNGQYQYMPAEYNRVY